MAAASPGARQPEGDRKAADQQAGTPEEDPHPRVAARQEGQVGVEAD